MRKLFLSVGALLIGVAAAAQAPAQEAAFGHYRPSLTFSEHVSTTQYLPMRDGLRLALRITRPARNGQAAPGPFPVIWQHALTVTEAADATQMPSAAGLSHLPALVAYGYVVVQVARRGNGQSFGSRRGYNDETETDDAYEVTEWLARQPWSTGRVGIYGCSNTGDAAMHALAGRPPHLQAVFAGCFSWSKYDAMRRGGIFAQWGTGPQRTVAEDMTAEPVDADAGKSLLAQAAQEHQQSTNLLELWRQMPYRDSASALVGTRFWSESSISSYADQLRQLQVPVYVMGGWHDELRDQGIIALLNLPHSRILIGPWQHCMNPGFELLQEIHRFFDTYLQGRDTGLAAEPRVHYYTIGDDGAAAWHAAATWPVPGAAAERWFIAAADHLALKAPAKAASAAFSVRTDVDCPQGGVGPFMQPCLHEGQGLSFLSPPLERARTVTGNPVLQVGLRLDRADANVFAYLTDTDATGKAVVITEGRLKASLRAESPAPFAVPGTPWHRAFAEDSQPVRPGEIVTLRIDLLPTSYRIPAGHRVGVTVMGADYRERARDPGIEGTRITLLSDPASPAWLDLPLDPQAP